MSASLIGSDTFPDVKLPSPACVPLGARGTNELGRRYPGGTGARFFLFFFFFFFFFFFLSVEKGDALKKLKWKKAHSREKL